MPKGLILITEDDPFMSRMYRRLFAFEGFEVEIAGNGQEGLDKAHAARPALILLDIMMPVMNGLTMLEHLKLDPVTKDIPVIMLTNLAGRKDAEATLSKGAVRYVIKSEHEPNQVADIVKEVLDTYTGNN